MSALTLLESPAEILSRYKTYRDISDEFHNEVLDFIGPNSDIAAAMKLNMWDDGDVIVQSNTEAALLCDQNLYGLNSHGVNPIQMYFKKNPQNVDSVRNLVATAMLNFQFRLLRVEKTNPGLCVECHDLLRGENITLVDRSLSTTAVVGCMVACRTLSVPGFEFNTGAGLPVTWATFNLFTVKMTEIAKYSGSRKLDLSDRVLADNVAILLYNLCLDSGAADHMIYRTGNSQSEMPILQPRLSQAELEGASRNRPCPCGSGLKMKRCCGELKKR